MPSSPTRSTYTVFQFPKARSPCATRRSLMGHPTSSRPLASETRSLGNKNLSSFTDVLLLTRYLGMPRPPTATLAIRTLLTSFRDQIHVQVFFCAFTFHDRPAEVAFIISSTFQPPSAPRSPFKFYSTVAKPLDVEEVRAYSDTAMTVI